MKLKQYQQNEWSYSNGKYLPVAKMPWKQVILNGFLVVLTFGIAGALGVMLAYRG